MNKKRLFSSSFRFALCQSRPMILLAALLLLSVTTVWAVPVADSVPEYVISTKYERDFESDSATAWNVRGILPEGWTFMFSGTDTALAPHVSADYSTTGNAILMASGNDAAYGESNVVILPQITIPLENLTLTFYSQMESGSRGRLEFGCVYQEGDSLVFQSFVSYSNTLSPMEHTCYLRTFAPYPANHRLAFRWKNQDSAAHCSIDNILLDSIPYCYVPSNVTVPYVNENSAQVTWTPGWNEHTWRVVYCPAGQSPSGVVPTTVNTPSFVITGLQPTASYDVYVQAVCSGGTYTEWTSATTFTTRCSLRQVPFMETFDSHPATAAMSPGTVPDCWEIVSSATDQGHYPHVTNTQGYIIEGNSVVMYSSSHASFGASNYLALPRFSNDLNGTSFSFTAYQYTGAPNYRFTFGYFVNDLNPSSFVALENVPVQATPSKFTYSLNGRGIPEGAQLALLQQGGVGTGFYTITVVDSISVDFLPCAPVTDIRTSNVMMTSAHVEWTPAAWEQAWRVEYGETGFAHGTGITVSTDTPAIDLEFLTGETTYDVYVQSVCDPDNLSDYSEPVSFYTYCSVMGDTTVATSCDSMSWRNHIYYETGTYFDTVPRVAAWQCDSIYTLDLTINRSVYREDTLVICQNQLPYQWGDTTFEVGTTDTNIVFKYTSSLGCDSIVALQLYVNPSYSLHFEDTICEQDLPYIWNDTIFPIGTPTGNYVFRYASVLGCDSIVNLHLVVNPGYQQLELLQVCEHEFPYTWRDTTFEEGTESGVFTFSRQSQWGCDSVVTLALVVTRSATTIYEDTICKDELPYVWRDTIFMPGTTSGYFYFQGSSSMNCENTVLHLVVGGMEQDIAHPDTVRICRNEFPYVWHGNLADVTFQSNITRGLRRVTTTGGGCTDINYLFIDILETSDVEVSETICSSELPYTTHDTTFAVGTTSGTYFVQRPLASGCINHTTIHLTVNPSYQIHDTLVLCSSELPYRWRNEWLQVGMTSGTYTYARRTAKNCDSTVTLHLTVNQTYYEMVPLAVCENELPIEWRGHILPRGTQSGSYRYNETSVAGCDSIVTLYLTVNPTYRFDESLSICDNELPYTWRDTTFAVGTTSSIYLFEKQSAAGCDSTVVLRLTVNRSINESETLDICRSELPYRWRDTTFQAQSTSGTYTFRRHTSRGCDSIVTLQLAIHESFGSNESLVVCENELPVEWRGNIIPRGTHTGNIIYREQTSFGCDSIVILSLVVNPSYRHNESLVICENELPYVWRDTTFLSGTRGGSYYFEKQSVSGCDSTVLLTLTIHPSFAFENQISICESELPYHYGDTTFQVGTHSGTFVMRRTSMFGCDSIITLHLAVHPTVAVNDAIALCESEFPYVYGDTVFQSGTQTGTYVLRRHTTFGCDSVVTLALTVYPSGFQTKNYTICSDELPYVTDDTIFPVGTVSGTYPVYYRTQHGCDSVVSISLVVRPTYSENASAVICQNELPYSWRDTTFQVGTESGIYSFVRTSSLGCDSLVTLALIVNPAFYLDEDAEVCANGFPFVWRDTTFLVGTVSGEYQFYRHTVRGCDSVVTLHLVVNPTYNLNEQMAICQSELPYVWRDTTFQTGTASGFYTFHRVSVSGCDSIVTLALTVYPSSTQSYNLRICTDDLPYTWSVTDTTFEEGTTSGTYYFHYTNILGCDSNVVLNLVVNESYRFYDTLALCRNELPYYYEPGHHTFPANTNTGDYMFTYQTVAGCDSIVYLALTIHQSYSEQVIEAICADDFPFVWRDTAFTDPLDPGTYFFNFVRTSQFGCDSLVSLTLTVNAIPNVVITQIPSGNNVMLLASGTSGCTYMWSTGMDATMIQVPADSSATYSVTATNINTGCSNSTSVEIGVGIYDNDVVAHNVVVYPNPTEGNVTVKAENEVINEIRIFNMVGRLVKTIRVSNTEVELDLNDLSAGTYLLQMNMQQGDVVRKKLIVR